MLTDEQVKQFQSLYKQKYGQEISRKVAYEKGIKLVQLMKLIYLPNNDNYPKTYGNAQQKNDSY